MRIIDFSKYKRVCVIGNGFDLNLGLKTSYSDFIHSDIFQFLIDRKNLNRLCLYLKNKEKLQNWIDIENELKEYSNKNDCRNLKEDYDELKSALTLYINTIDYNTINKNSTAYRLLNSLYQYSDILFLNFNYTNTIQNILVSLTLNEKKSNEKVLNIHGTALSNNIIFGVEDSANIKREYVFLKKAYDNNYSSINIPELFKNVNHFVFFGHSLGVTDHTYFEDLFFASSINTKGINYTFYYKDNKAYLEMMKQIDILTRERLSSFKQNNNVVAIHV